MVWALRGEKREWVGFVRLSVGVKTPKHRFHTSIHTGSFWGLGDGDRNTGQKNRTNGADGSVEPAS